VLPADPTVVIEPGSADPHVDDPFVLNLPAAAAPGSYMATVHWGDNGKTATGSFLVGVRDSSGNCAASASGG